MNTAIPPAKPATHKGNTMIKELLKTKSSWEKIASTEKPVVIYGTGNGADIVFDRFAELGIQVSAVVASEGFVRSREFRGFKVKSIRDAQDELGDFLLCIAFATSLPDVMDNIKELSKKHETLMPVVPVFGNNIFDREFLEENASAFTNSRALLADDESRRVFDNIIRFQYSGNLSYLFASESSRTDALRDILKLGKNENILDLGAYRGDTLEEIISLFGGFTSAVALEPDRKSFEKLCEYAKGKNNIKPLPYAVWDSEAEFEFSGGGGRQSTLFSKGKYKVRAIAIDDILGKETVSYVKMDVEGAEKEALLGMQNLLKTQQPSLSIAAYHRSEDFSVLIPLIKSINPEYKIYLRHHPYIPAWDTNLYCI